MDNITRIKLVIRGLTIVAGLIIFGLLSWATWPILPVTVVGIGGYALFMWAWDLL